MHGIICYCYGFQRDVIICRLGIFVNAIMGLTSDLWTITGRVKWILVWFKVKVKPTLV